MWCNDLYFAARSRDAMQLIHETEHIGNMLDHMTTNDLFKLIVTERIRKRAEVVNDVGMTRRVCIDADCAGKLILTTADIKNFLPRRCR